MAMVSVGERPPYLPRNQSEIHAALVQMALRWAASRTTQRGARYAEELTLGPGYVADLVSLQAFSPPARKEFTPNPNVIDELALIFEAKASRSDFLATFGESDRHANRLDPVGHFHFVVSCKGVCEPADVPKPWGLLVQRGSGLSVYKRPEFTPEAGASNIGMIAHRMLWKHDQGHYRRHGFAR